MSTTEPRKVGVHEAKTHFSELIRAVEAGENVIITRGGTPVAQLAAPPKPKRVADSLGLFAGQFQLADDFDAADAMITELFEGSTLFPDAPSD